jgi:hypothetical protein
VPVTVFVRKNEIAQVQASVIEKTVKAVRDNAKFMRDYAKSIAPVQTGAFRDSLYVNGPNDESDYAERAAAAKNLNPKANIVPEIQAAHVDPQVDRVRDRFGRFSLPEAVVSSAVEHALYLEEGTVRMGPRPTFRPAALVAEQQFKADMAKVADGF